MDERKNHLVGRTLLGVQLEKDGDAIKFSTDLGDMIVWCFGDCCSTTWIESVELPALGFPALVTAVEDLDLSKEPDWSDDGEYIQFYGCKVTTDRGDLVIDYRNSSNGYYGGNLEWPKEWPRLPDGAASVEWVDVRAA